MRSRTDFASDFWFGRESGSGGARYFVHLDTSVDGARTLLGRLVAEQKNEYIALMEGGHEAILQHRFLHTFFAVRAHGSAVFGIDGAADRNAAEAALGRLEEGLNREIQAHPAP